LMEAAAVQRMVSELLPLARLVTPNIPEAEVLTGSPISNEEEMRGAAAKLREMGARAVLIKGGHRKCEPGATQAAMDVLDDQGEVLVLRGEWIETAPVRGTGCMMSAAIAASLASGADLISAVKAAKKYVTSEIQNSKFKIQN
jgi:hydroxymethylpyrimidine kinase/phosphomethylpyrimidine kinase